MQTVDNGIHRRNSLNTVRLLAAISVFYIHATRQMGILMPNVINQIVSYFQGVPIFFAMSGFLVWDSVGRSKGLWSYARKRILRIYPELWAAVFLGLVTILVLYDAPIQWSRLGMFTVTQGTVLQFWTPEFLRGYGCGTPNGSLWTIGVTVQFYIAIYFLYKCLRTKRLSVWTVVVVGAISVAVISPLLQNVLPGVVYKLYNQTILPYAWWFLLGAMAAANRDAILPFLQKWCILFLALSAILKLAHIDISLGSYNLFCSGTLILGVIGFAYRFPKINCPVDISYGIYIYHMIVVNAMIELGYTKKLVYLLMAFLITFLLSFVSERFVGRMGMRVKARKL